MRDNVVATTGLSTLGNLDFASKDNGQALANLANLDQRFAGTIGPEDPKAAQAFNLRRREDGKHLVSARIDD
jgi:hypothetical protein